MLKHASQGQHHRKKKDELTFVILVGTRACKQFKAIFFFDLQSLLKSFLFTIWKNDRTLSNWINICVSENYRVLESREITLFFLLYSETNQTTAKFLKSTSSLLYRRSHCTRKEETRYVCHSYGANLLLFSCPSESTFLWKLGTILVLTIFTTLP